MASPKLADIPRFLGTFGDRLFCSTTQTTKRFLGHCRDGSARPAEGRAGVQGDEAPPRDVAREMWLCAAIISELRTSRWLCAGLAASTGLYALAHAATALAAGLLGRELVRHGGAPELAQPARVEIYSILVLGLLATVAKSFSGVFSAYYESQLAGRVGRSLRKRAVLALLAHGSYDAPPRVLATIAVRIREVESATGAGAVVLARAVAQLVPLAAALIWVSAPMALAGSMALLPFAWLVARYRARWRAASAQSQDLVEQLHRGVDDLVRNVDLWRSYGAGNRVAGFIETTSRQAVCAAARVDGARAALSGANEVLGAVALLGAVVLALWLSIPLGDGTLIAFAAIFFLAYRPLRDLGDARAWCGRGAVAIDALTRLLGFGLIGPQCRSAGPLPVLAGPRCAANSIVHHDSSVADRLVVQGVGARDRGPRTSLVLEAGRLLSVVGPTGSGKTTLLRVLLGLEPPVGSVSYGCQDLTHASVGPDARPFAWVPQDAPLVTATVLDNVALHAPHAGAAAEALRQIGAERLLELRDELVGPGGRTLSGGERRQVAIARALASGQPVLLLDEPTAGLDQHAARCVLDALDRLRGQRSVLIATHSQAVTAVSDVIVSIGNAGSCSGGPHCDPGLGTGGAKSPAAAVW